MIRALFIALALSACASPRHEQTHSRDRVQTERDEDAVKRMQDEFNALVPNG